MPANDPPDQSTVAGNREVVTRFVDEVLLGGELDVIAELCHPDVVNHTGAAGRQHGFDGVSHAVRESLLAVADQRWLDMVLVAQDDYVMVHATREATWRAPEFRGVPIPTEGPVSAGIVHVFRLRGGLIVEHWAVHDELSILQQRGALG